VLQSSESGHLYLVVDGEIASLVVVAPRRRRRRRRCDGVQNGLTTTAALLFHALLLPRAHGLLMIGTAADGTTTNASVRPAECAAKCRNDNRKIATHDKSHRRSASYGLIIIARTLLCWKPIPLSITDSRNIRHSSALVSRAADV